MTKKDNNQDDKWGKSKMAINRLKKQSMAILFI